MSAARGGIARVSGVAAGSFGGRELRSVAWFATLRRMGTWLKLQRRWPVLQPRMRRLEVKETMQLGEKRFVSILRVDGEQFLIGGSPGGVTLLAALKPEAAPAFAAVLATEERQACA